MTHFALHNKVVTFVALCALALAGLSAYRTMPQKQDPGFTIRTAQIVTRFPGASPERIEELVTDPLEQVIQEMPELKDVTSTSRTGVSIIAATFLDRYGADQMQPIYDDLRRKVGQVKLPAGTIAPEVNDDFGDVFGTVLTLTGDGYTYAELKDVADEVRAELLKLDQVAKITIHGIQEERIFVEYNNARLAELGLSTNQLVNILTSRNILISGGKVNTGDEQLQLEPSGNFESLDDLRQTVITLPSRQTVFLEDIATVTRGYIDPPTAKTTVNGEPGLALAISMPDDGNIIELGRQVRARIDELIQIYPIGIEFGFVSFQADTVEESVNNFIGNMYQAVGLVIIVMLFFLGIRTGLVVAALIPMAMLLAFYVMSSFGMSINQVSLAALIIALGLLVDNAIVMSENIMVMMEEGKPAMEAALESANELRIPLLISSLTTAVAFLPMYLAESTVGEYVGVDLFGVVTITLLSSWFLAMTMTPLLCAMFVKIKKKQQNTDAAFNSRFYRLYRSILLQAVSRPFRTMAIAFGALLISVWAFRFIPNVFFPSQEDPQFTADFELPQGSPFSRTEAFIATLETWMQQELQATAERPDGLANWTTFIGGNIPRFNLGAVVGPSRDNTASMILNASSYEVQGDLIDRIQTYVDDHYPEVVGRVTRLQNGPTADYPIEIRVSGQETDGIYGLVDGVKSQVGSLPGVRYVTDNWGKRIKKLTVEVDEARARRAGVSSQDVAISLQTALSGYETTQFREDDKVIPIMLRSSASDRQDLGKLETISVFSQGSGQNVPLKQVADIELNFQQAQIERRNQNKTVTIQVALDADANTSDVLAQIRPWLENEAAAWPSGYTFELGGENENAVEAQQSIADQMPLAGLLILFLLVLQFNSLRKPAIIILTIPLGLIGVVIGLLLTGLSFGFMTLLGLVSLCGIVINNAIVLIDRIELEMSENGLEPTYAVFEAAQRRFRPIMMTTATTSLSLIPLWLAGGPLFESMAVAILFGLLFATVLTLGVVPVLYTLLFRVSFKGFRYGDDEPPPKDNATNDTDESV